MKKLLIILSLVFLADSFFAVSFAQTHPFLKYFPANEKIDTRFIEYSGGRALNESTCNPDLGWATIQDSTDCLTCMGWKDTCPNCCIDDASVEYACASSPTALGNRGGYLPMPFDNDCDGVGRVDCTSCSGDECGPDPEFDNCSAADLADIPNCQQEGCPVSDALALVSLPDACVNVSGSIYCTRDDILPLDIGCKPKGSAKSEPTLNYENVFHSPSARADDFYNVIEHSAGTFSDSDPVPLAFNVPALLDGGFEANNDDCYEYAPGAFTTYVSSCPAYADSTEAGYKDNYCCQASVCSGVGMGSCDTRVDDPATPGDETGGCQSIIDNWAKTVTVAPGVTKNCYAIEPYECVALQELVQNCLNNPAGGCSACFQEIDSNFRYEFVPKSGESLVMLWLIKATPTIPAGMSPFFNTYFYTMVKVYEVGEDVGLPLPSDIVHQKNFNSAFNIYSAMSIDKDDLEVGSKYEIRISYFIPDDDAIPAGEHLTMNINRMEMNIFRVRE